MKRVFAFYLLQESFMHLFFWPRYSSFYYSFVSSYHILPHNQPRSLRDLQAHEENMNFAIADTNFGSKTRQIGTLIRPNLYNTDPKIHVRISKVHIFDMNLDTLRNRNWLWIHLNQNFTQNRYIALDMFWTVVF